MARSTAALHSAQERTRDLRQRAFDEFINLDCAEVTVKAMVETLKSFGTSSDTAALESGRRLLADVSSLNQEWVESVDTYGGSEACEADDLGVVNDAGNLFWRLSSNFKATTRLLDEYASTNAGAARAARSRHESAKANLERAVGAAVQLWERLNGDTSFSTPTLLARARGFVEQSRQFTLATSKRELDAFEADVLSASLESDSYRDLRTTLPAKATELALATQVVIEQLPAAEAAASQLLRNYALNCSVDLHRNLRQVRGLLTEVIEATEQALVQGRAGNFDEVSEELGRASETLSTARGSTLR